MAEPFVDYNTENKTIRALVCDSDVDSKEIQDEISNNISYLVNLDFSKDIFHSPFKQWLYEKIIENHSLFSECLEKNSLLKSIHDAYQKTEAFENKKIIFDKIFKDAYRSKSFKPLVEELRHKQHYRELLELNKNLNENLHEHYTENKNDAVVLAKNIEEISGRILTSTSRLRIIEEDILKNIDGDISLIRDRKANPEKYRGILTGYDYIDRATGGFRPGELVGVFGRPGAGKSILLLNFGFNAYQAMNNVVYVTIEMPIEQQKLRFYSSYTKTEYEKLKFVENLPVDHIDYMEEKLKGLKERHKDNNFWIIDAPENCNAAFLESRICSYENTFGRKVNLVVIDPIYLMKPINPKSEDPVGSISWDLKTLARKLRIPVLYASQINRSAQKRYLMGKEVQSDTMDASFTDKLGHNSDVMMMLVLNKTDKNRMLLQFPKTRDSYVRDLYLVKEYSTMSFRIEEIAREEKPEKKKKKEEETKESNESN